MRQPEFQPIQTTETIADLIPSPADTFKSILDFTRRQYPVIALALGVAIVLGLIYVLTTPPSFTATATMMIDAKKVQLFQQQSLINDLPVDAATVESQVEVLKSETIAQAVIDKLHLAEDQEFINPGAGLFGTIVGSIMGLFETSGPVSEFRQRRAAVQTLLNNMSIRRVGLTYVITISYQALSPQRASEIANAIANAYIDDQLEAKFDAARRAGTWLQARLRELREQASNAERAVVAFKNKNEMIDTGGRTINEQQLAELNSELVVARSKTSEERAKLDRVKSVLSSPESAVSGTVADTLKSEVISKLRTQYLELSRRESDWAVRYGTTHLAVVNLRNQMRELQNSIHAELERIAETYKSDYEISKQHEDSVQKQLDLAVSQSQVTNEAQVALRELESNAQTYRALYDNFLQRYMESVQQQSFPITEARVITAASPPLSKSKPKVFLVLGLAMFLGLGIGFVGAAWRDFADRVFRTILQVESLLQTECIALLPKLDLKEGKKDITREQQRKLGAAASNVRVLDAAQNIKVSQSGPFSEIVDGPFSAYTEGIRTVKVAIDLSPTVTGARIIGFTSSIPNEGKSSTAAALARLVAQTGARTLLIDCDLRNPSMSRLLAPTSTGGFQEVIAGKATLASALWTDPATNLRFLPANLKGRLAHSSEFLASPHTRKFFETVRQNYDYIFVDFSPLMPIVDVRVSTKLVDSYIYVVAWGDTRIDYVTQALRSAKGVYDNLLGVVLNKVDLMSLGRYDGGGGSYYSDLRYRRYGYTA